MTDEFDDYLATAMKNPEFRSAFERARDRPHWRQWLMNAWARRPFRPTRRPPTAS